MKIQVYRSGVSSSADLLVAALTTLGHQASRNNYSSTFSDEPVVVGWGVSGYDINTHAGEVDKYEELLRMTHCGVPCPEMRQLAPRAEIRAGLWLGRTRHHRRARDLRRPRTSMRENGGQWDYYTRKLDIVDEFRAHVFRNHRRPDEYLVVRSGHKVPCPGETPHPWIRSRLSGWNISYDGVRLGDALRDAAKAAVKALELDFGAVDLGITLQGDPVVFEVNTAPSLDNPNTAKVYAERIVKFAQQLAGVRSANG